MATLEVELTGYRSLSDVVGVRRFIASGLWLAMDVTRRASGVSRLPLRFRHSALRTHRSVLLCCVLLALTACQHGLTPEGLRGGSSDQYGSIQVNSTPTGAAVWLDTINTGQTTNCLLTSVTSGSHTVRLTLLGYADWYKSVDVTAGQTATVETTLVASVGNIQVNSTPSGAAVWLDTVNTGQTTNCLLSNVAVGNHTVKLTLAGYADWYKSIDVAEGQTTGMSVIDPARPKAQALAMAIRGAKVDAQRNLLETIRGVRVVSETKVEDLMTKGDYVYTRIEGVIKGATVVGGLPPICWTLS